ncbi:MAG: hypothetical protein Q8L88_01630 [Bacteroidota bacterium]|nr:hypothetical protein [Bacteroidota bacterium]
MLNNLKKNLCISKDKSGHTANCCSPMLIYVLIVSMFLSSCSGAMNSPAAVNYIYTYTMTQPQKNDKLIFRDNYLFIQFFIDQSAISFQLQNVSGASMSIVWEKVSLGVNKRTFAVRNTSTFYSLGNSAPLPLAIPSLGYIREIVIPRENVFVKKEKWVEKEFFLTNDRGSQRYKKAITGMVGSEVTLTIPVKIGEIIVEYPFVFKVSAVTPLPSNVLPPVKSRPPVPKTNLQEAGAGSDLVPIMIAAGVFGVAIYLLSQKKTPAADL